MSDNRNVHSPLLPGGNLIAAVLDREVMGLADRGGASGLVGARWAALCAEWTDGWVDQQLPVPDAARSPFVVERVVRLDHRPEIERAASKRALQNPDFLLIGHRDCRATVQAADAKFSVETARSKQVSPAVVEGLLRLGEVLRPAVGDLPSPLDIASGVFFCPDYPMTHVMLRRRRGIVRVTVNEREVIPVPASSRWFFDEIDGASIMPIVAGIDDLAVRTEESLLAGIYYFRLARAAIGCWLDSVKPLLLFNDQVEADVDTVCAETESRAKRVKSAFDLILAWNADVDTIRAQRAAVEQVAGLPITGRELRGLIERVADGATEPPSINQVRRRLGAWYRQELRERVGPLQPPIANLPHALQAVATAGAAVAPQVERQARQIVESLIAQQQDLGVRPSADAGMNPHTPPTKPLLG